METALITGSSSGIGYAICNKFLEHGFKVYGISRTKSDFKNNNFTWLKCDLQSEESIESAIKKIKEPRLDVLVCNAGIAKKESSMRISKVSFTEIFNINVLASMLIVKILSNKLNDSTLINISAITYRKVIKDYALFCSSKAASLKYFETLALELPNCSVYSILPGHVDTPLLRLHLMEGYIELSHAMKPEQIAELTYRLYKKEIINKTGSNIMVSNRAIEEGENKLDNLFYYNVDTHSLSKIK